MESAWVVVTADPRHARVRAEARSPGCRVVGRRRVGGGERGGLDQRALGQDHRRDRGGGRLLGAVDPLGVDGDGDAAPGALGGVQAGGQRRPRCSPRRAPARWSGPWRSRSETTSRPGVRSSARISCRPARSGPEVDSTPTRKVEKPRTVAPTMTMTTTGSTSRKKSDRRSRATRVSDARVMARTLTTTPPASPGTPRRRRSRRRRRGSRRSAGRPWPGRRRSSRGR